MSTQNQLLHHTDKNKWERMLSLVNKHATLLKPNSEQQFKKLVLTRLLLNNILIFFIQYSGLSLNSLSPNLSPVWFASGTSCAYLFLRGYSVLPGIWLGIFFACFFAKAGFIFSISFSTVLSLQATGLFWFSVRSLGQTLVFYNIPLYMKFIGFTTGLTAVTSLILVFLCTLLITKTEFSWIIWIHYWLGNLNAILILSCAYITWDAFFLSHFTIKPLHKRLLLCYTLYTLLVCITVVLILNTIHPYTFFLMATHLLITFLISTIFGWGGAIAALFLSAIVFSVAAFLGAPTFYTSFASFTVLLVQLLLCVETMIGLSIAIHSS